MMVDVKILRNILGGNMAKGTKNPKNHHTFWPSNSTYESTLRQQSEMQSMIYIQECSSQYYFGKKWEATWMPNIRIKLWHIKILKLYAAFRRTRSEITLYSMTARKRLRNCSKMLMFALISLGIMGKSSFLFALKIFPESCVIFM